MTGSDLERRPLQVLRVYHSAVVTAWRRREEALADAGVDAAVIAPRRWNEGGALVDLDVRPGERVECVPTVGKHPFLFWYRPLPLWRALRRNRRVDLLDLHEEPAALAAVETVAMARLAGLRAPIVCYSAQNILKRYPPPFRWFERWVLGRLAAVHSCNDDVATVLEAKGFAADVVNLGLGVDVGPIGPTDEPRGPTPGSFRIGYVGRFTDQKGIFTLVSALAMLDGVDATFVGAGPDEPRLRAAIRRRGLDGRVRVEGYRAHDDLPGLYRSFDAIVVPSLDRPEWKEQFGRVAVEAMACGTPVIVSDGGSLPDVAADAALVVPQGDAMQLTRAMKRIRDEPTLRAELRTRGLARARDFSWERIAARQAALYRSVIGRETEGRFGRVRPQPGTTRRHSRGRATSGRKNSSSW